MSTPPATAGLLADYAAQIGAAQSGAAQSGAAQIGAAQIGAAQIGAASRDQGRRGGAPDELVDGHGEVRDHWTQIVADFDRFDPDELQRRRSEIRRLLEQDGVTYNVTTGGRRRHQPWNLDAVPLVMPHNEWAHIEAGIVQRSQLLDMVFTDLYGERQLLRDGIIPPSIVLNDPQFLRQCDGIRLPSHRQLMLTGTDLARTTNDGWVALGQRTQAPSGVAYALENRRVLARVFPSLFQQSQVQRAGIAVRALRSALRAASPPGVEDPSIVILSPGPMSETAFEHASIAAQLGYPLVQGADLQVRDGQVWLRTVGRLQRVHVILRRVDAWFCDPLELLPESTLGIPGLVDACRSGAVSVVNPLGAGVLENAALQTVLPELANRLLGQDLLLPSVQAWWCGVPAQQSHVLANLGQIIVRPASRMAHGSSIDTTRSSQSELEQLGDLIRAQPDQWVGQELIQPATSPMLGPSGMQARATILRTFTMADGDDYLAMPGGLARAAASESALIASRMGAIAKDVWITGGVLDEDDDLASVVGESMVAAIAVAPSARAAEHLFWLGRYAERAEATVRMLRSVNERRNEFQQLPGGPGAAALTALYETLTRITGTFPGFVGDDAAALRTRPDTEMLSLLTNATRTGTVAHAIVHMFDAIDVLRDQLSVDTWLVVGSLQRELEDRALDDGEASEGNPDDEHASDATTRILNDLLEGLLALAGVAAESTVRDQAWHFMESGRRLERALQIGALLCTTLTVERGAAAESLLLDSVLTTSESIITYRRRYRSRARLSSVLELLLVDAANPRSLVFQLESLQRSLVELDPAGTRPRTNAASELVAKLLTRLRDCDVGELANPGPTGRRFALDDLGSELRTSLRECSDLIRSDYFTQALPQRSVATMTLPSK